VRCGGVGRPFRNTYVQGLIQAPHLQISRRQRIPRRHYGPHRDVEYARCCGDCVRISTPSQRQGVAAGAMHYNHRLNRHVLMAARDSRRCRVQCSTWHGWVLSDDSLVRGGAVERWLGGGGDGRSGGLGEGVSGGLGVGRSQLERSAGAVGNPTIERDLLSKSFGLSSAWGKNFVTRGQWCIGLLVRAVGK
jgi:hypothetical protein